jgi:hypothetical protein
MARLKAQNKELRIRPPIEEFAASHFGYRPTQQTESDDNPTPDFPESELPEYEP